MAAYAPYAWYLSLILIIDDSKLMQSGTGVRQLHLSTPAVDLAHAGAASTAEASPSKVLPASSAWQLLHVACSGHKDAQDGGRDTSNVWPASSTPY